MTAWLPFQDKNGHFISFTLSANPAFSCNRRRFVPGVDYDAVSSPDGDIFFLKHDHIHSAFYPLHSAFYPFCGRCGRQLLSAHRGEMRVGYVHTTQEYEAMCYAEWEFMEMIMKGAKP